MQNIAQAAGKMIRHASEGLANSFQAMPSDRQNWSPLEEGRTALDQIQECARVNAWAAKVLQDRAMTAPSAKAEETVGATGEAALAHFRAMTETLLAAIESFPSEHLGVTVALPWGQTSSLGEFMLVPYWNMVYHLGQINYIQTLYGDKAMH